MTEKTVVRFLKAWRGYSAGELAGFDEPVVEGLESKGFAEIYKGDGEPTTKAKSGKGKTQKGGGSTPGNANTNVEAGTGTGTETGAGAGTDPDDEKP